MTEHFSRLFCFPIHPGNGMTRAVRGDSEEEEKSPAPLRHAPFGRDISPRPFAAVEMTVEGKRQSDMETVRRQTQWRLTAGPSY